MVSSGLKLFLLLLITCLWCHATKAQLIDYTSRIQYLYNGINKEFITIILKPLH